MAKQTRFKKIAVSLALVAMTYGFAPTLSAEGAAGQKTPARASAKKSAAKKPAPKKKAYSASTARARRATLARAREASRTRELRELQTPRFRVDEFGREVPDVRAEAAIIYNPETGEVLWENHSTEQRSMASITKVMTALVFLESNTPLTDIITVQPIDVRAASTTYLRAGYKVTRDDLLHLLLIGSDNAAARALARTSPTGTEGFVRRMNEKAAELGLQTTSYADPSGLLNANVSSAYDMARLISYVSGNERIASIMRTPHYTVQAGSLAINVNSTNQLVKAGDVDVQAGKTGFIRSAGYCLATLLRLPQGGPDVAVVVLGAKSNAGRFWETRHLFNWLAGKAENLLGGAVEAKAAAPPASE
ncbi:MAG TPA: serine hydrolase [Opitutaceae bacterium]|nr:serine hydrolase [Opitutaceae bacterium]